MKIITAFFLLLLISLPLFPRDVTIEVLDSDLNLPLEGATIRIRDGSEYICNQNGIALIQVPDDRQIIINVFYPGYETGILTIPVSENSFTVLLRLSGILQGRELVVEASKPGLNETRTGRSIAVNTREISQTAEIGIIEDVMSTIKLLPGVSYSGVFNAQPSIRGGFPGDMSATLDGYYINNPYFWGGGFSIFDPRMVKSAQLSHGVFSSRYGHTISGLLEISTKDPSPTDTQLELGLNSSAANLSLSVPLNGKGGILFMGRITYYDPIIALGKSLSDKIPEFEAVHYIRQAPYIRAATINGNYRFTDIFEISATGFFGMDGVGVNFENQNRTQSLISDSSTDFDFRNYQGFLTTSLFWNPKNNMLVKITLGTGYEKMLIDGEREFNIYDKAFSDIFGNKYPDLFDVAIQRYKFNDTSGINQSDFLYNAQGRIDFDWEVSEYIMLSAGVQEMFNFYQSSGSQRVSNDVPLSYLGTDEQLKIKDALSSYNIPSDSEVWKDLRIIVPVRYYPDHKNHLFTTSGYILNEYYLFNNRINAEIGLRLDHFYLQGMGFSLSSDPVLNPRLNLDINILKNTKILQSLNLSLGTGLFSSVSDNVFIAEERYEVNKMKPNRSWTSITGLRFEFPQSLSLNIEGYYKYIFDRMYIPFAIQLDDLDIQPNFDGIGKVYGLDVMLHKVQSRFWDGWLAYSYNWTKYQDPQGRYGRGLSGGNRGDDWYFPQFHRFHNLNLVFNYKPVQNMNFYLRFGIASGVQRLRRIGDGPDCYPVLVYNNISPEDSYFIEKFYWLSEADENNRTLPSFPMDFKYSIFGSNKNGKARYEVYFALENLLAFVYAARRSTSYNTYTGTVDTGSSSARYDIPMPIPSFGIKISY